MREFDETRPGGAMTKYIEPKVSLMWLISGFLSLLSILAVAAWNLSSANEKMARIGESVRRLEAQVEQRDARFERMQLEISTNRSMNDVQNARILNIEEQLRALKAFSGVKP